MQRLSMRVVCGQMNATEFVGKRSHGQADGTARCWCQKAKRLQHAGVIPLTPRVSAFLKSRWEAAGRPSEGFVWPSATKSGHINHSPLKKQHTHAVKLAGIRPFVLYSLRHSFATRIAPYLDAWTLCKIMGWSSLSVAMRYIHPSDDRVLEALGVLSGTILGQPEGWRISGTRSGPIKCSDSRLIHGESGRIRTCDPYLPGYGDDYGSLGGSCPFTKFCLV